MNFNSPPTQEPLFFRNTDIDSENNPVTVLEVCNAMARSIGARSVDGAQQIRGIWRLYTKSKEARVELLIKGINIRGRHVELTETNPRNLKQDDPDAPVEKIIFKDVPLSVDNKVIMSYLKDHPHVQLTTNVRYSRERNDDGSLSNFRNGDRFVFALQPVVPPLKSKDNIGTYTARIYHHSQNLTCKACNLPGHRPKTDDCPAYDPDMNIIPFRSRYSKLSNFYPCDLKVEGYDTTFASVEHYFQWKKAICIGKTDVADQILDAPHAAAAKSIADNNLVKEENSKFDEEAATTAMEKALRAKLECCPEFHQALMETGDAILAEATTDTYWGSGLLPKVVKTTKPDFWPGKNVLGQMLMKLREEEQNYQAFQKSRYQQWVNDIQSEEEGDFAEASDLQEVDHDHDHDTDDELDDSKMMHRTEEEVHHDDEHNTEDEVDDSKMMHRTEEGDGWQYEEKEGNAANEYSYTEYPPLPSKSKEKKSDEYQKEENITDDAARVEINMELFDDSCDFDDDLPTHDPMLTPSGNEVLITSTQVKSISEKAEEAKQLEPAKMPFTKIQPNAETPLLQSKIDSFITKPNKRDTPDDTSPEPQSTKHQRMEEGEKVT